MSTKHLLQSAAHEIRSLRSENKLLKAQADTVEVFRLALSKGPREYPPMAPDVVWQLEREVAEMEQELIGVSSPDRAPANDLAKADVAGVVDPKRLREAIRRARSSGPIKQPRKGAKK